AGGGSGCTASTTARGFVFEGIQIKVGLAGGAAGIEQPLAIGADDGVVDLHAGSVESGEALADVVKLELDFDGRLGFGGDRGGGGCRTARTAATRGGGIGIGNDGCAASTAGGGSFGFEKIVEAVFGKLGLFGNEIDAQELRDLGALAGLEDEELAVGAPLRGADVGVGDEADLAAGAAGGSGHIDVAQAAIAGIDVRDPLVVGGPDVRAEETGDEQALLFGVEIDDAGLFAVADEGERLAVGRKLGGLIGLPVVRQLGFGVVNEIVEEDVGDGVALAE